MTVSVETSRIAYSGDAVTVAFAYPYKFSAVADLRVVLTDEDDGSEVEQTGGGVHFTTTGTGLSNGIYASGTVTFVTAPGSDKKISIFRDPALTQETDLTAESNDELAINRRFDIIEMKLQRLDDARSRSLRLSEGFWSTFDATLPDVDSVSAVAGMGPVLAAGLTEMTWATPAAGASVSAAMVPVVAAASIDAAMELLAQGDFTATGSTTARNLADRFAEVANVKDFGAGGDVVTNDGAAIQAAIDTGKTVFFPDGDYLVTADVLTVATAGQVLLGSPTGVIETGYGGARIVTASTSGKVFNITAHGVYIEGLAVEGTGVQSALYGFYAATPSNTDDVDLTLINCRGKNLTTFAYHNGRALTAKNNTFAGGAGSETMFELVFPTSGVGAGTFHDVPFGFRKTQIIGNVTHGNTNFIKVTGDNRVYFRGIIANNTNDIGGRFFEGAGADIIFSGNYTKHSSSTIYLFDGASESIQFLGETALGTPSDTDTSPASCIQFQSTATDIRITGGTYGDSDDSAFRFDGNVASLNITGVTIKNFGQNATGTDPAILFTSGITVTDATITGNTFIEGAGSDMPVYADGVTLTNVKAYGNVWDTAEGDFVQGTFTDSGGNEIQPEVMVRTYAANDTWTKRVGLKYIEIEVMGAGGGGGGGARNVATNAVSGGGGGGGARRMLARIPAASLSATEAVAIGAGGNSGPGATVDGNAGSNGTAGGNSSFGSHLISYGGGFGAGGLANNTGSGGGASSGSRAVGGNASGATGGTGGTPNGLNGGSAAASSTATADNVGTGGGGCTATTLVGGTGGAPLFGSGGGGGGGGVTAADAPQVGGGGVTAADAPQVGGGTFGGNNGATIVAGGAATGAPGGIGVRTGAGFGSGGGGGGGNAAGVGGAGGVGTANTGNGGGGGGAAHGGAGGAGGAGGSGYVRVIEHYA